MASSSEINANAILAIVYFASGATICGLNLVCISAIPECFGQPFRNVIPSPYLALLAALLLMSTIAVLPSTFVVPLIIGIESNALKGQITSNICSFLVRFALFSAFLFYLLIIVQRIIQMLHQSLRARLSSQCMICTQLISVIGFSFITTLILMKCKKILRFDRSRWIWIKPEWMLMNDLIVGSVFLVIVFLLYTITALHLLIEHFFVKSHEKLNQTAASTSNQLRRLTIYVFFDIVYIVLSAFIYSYPKQLNSIRSASVQSVLLGYLQSFGQSIWPVIGAFTCDAPIRNAILGRLHLMVKKDRLPDRKTRRRSQHRMKKFQIKANASPLFQFYPKNETPNNEHEHQRSSIVAVSRSDSAAIPHADSYAPSVAGSNKGT